MNLTKATKSELATHCRGLEKTIGKLRSQIRLSEDCTKISDMSNTINQLKENATFNKAELDNANKLLSDLSRRLDNSYMDNAELMRRLHMERGIAVVSTTVAFVVLATILFF